MTLPARRCPQDAARKTLGAVADYGAPLDARALRTLSLAKTTAAEAARALQRAGVLERVDGSWRVVDPLLARWIRRQPTRAPLGDAPLGTSARRGGQA